MQNEYARVIPSFAWFSLLFSLIQFANFSRLRMQINNDYDCHFSHSKNISSRFSSVRCLCVRHEFSIIWSLLSWLIAADGRNRQNNRMCSNQSEPSAAALSFATLLVYFRIRGACARVALDSRDSKIDYPCIYIRRPFNDETENCQL